MKERLPLSNACCENAPAQKPIEKDVGGCDCAVSGPPQQLAGSDIADEVCCGAPPAPPSHPDELPGYRRWHFVKKFMSTRVGKVPRVETDWDRRDYAGAVAVRSGIGRNRYTITPGLYCVGEPTAQSPVLVTANYKLSFDVLRKHLIGQQVWILVLDTRGINVWCAAGKKLFSTNEVVRMVNGAGLDRLVSHRRLILPQLAATGVAATEVKKACGFEVVWGPVRSRDIAGFFANDLKAGDNMRRVTFSLVERLVLIPVELSLIIKPTLWLFLFVFLFSGFDGGVFSISFSGAWARTLKFLGAYATGIFMGAVMVPALLPWMPGTAFSVKGAVGGIIGAIWSGFVFGGANAAETIAILLITVATSSYVAMNFTGVTPFTSPSGVEKEMRKAIPCQAGALLVAVVLWIGAGVAG